MKYLFLLVSELSFLEMFTNVWIGYVLLCVTEGLVLKRNISTDSDCELNPRSCIINALNQSIICQT